jgi:N-acetylglucosamine-6-phosphate deacetylase
MPFHSRNPGVLGAALGRKDLYLELIIDRAHLSPEVIRWTRLIHAKKPICFISDCISAGGTPGKGTGRNSTQQKSTYTLGSQQVQLKDGACRLNDGRLAGGGLTLSESYTQWVSLEAREQGIPVRQILMKTYLSATHTPLQVLGFSKKFLQKKKVLWKVASSGKIRVIPVDSEACSR